MESVILQNPLLCVVFAVALICCVCGVCFRTKKGVLSFVSLIVAVSASAYALLLGASLYETATVLMVFLLVNLMAWTKGKNR